MKVLGLLALLVVAAAAYAAYSLSQPYRSLPASSDPAGADAKVASLEQAYAEAQLLHRGVPFQQTFSDAQLTALANQHLGSDSTFGQVALHASAAGYVEGTGTAHAPVGDLPLYLKAVPVVQNGQAGFHVTETRLGSFPAPPGLSQALEDSLKLQDLPPTQNLNVAVADGSVTVTGTALPA